MIRSAALAGVSIPSATIRARAVPPWATATVSDVTGRTNRASEPAPRHRSRRPAATSSISRSGAWRRARDPAFISAASSLPKRHSRSPEAGRRAHSRPAAIPAPAGPNPWSRARDRAGWRQRQRCLVAPVALEEIGEDMAGMVRLRATEISQRNVQCSLQPAFRVPRGLAMAHVVDCRRRHRRRSYSLASELESEMSGASGRFMPTT